MGKKQVPTASELREYLAKERAYLVDWEQLLPDPDADAGADD